MMKDLRKNLVGFIACSPFKLQQHIPGYFRAPAVLDVASLATATPLNPTQKVPAPTHTLNPPAMRAAALVGSEAVGPVTPVVMEAR